MASKHFENKHRQYPTGVFKYEGERKIPNMMKACKIS
jgi:hypothetical protein